MKYLWTYIEKKDWPESKKYRAVIRILAVLFALAGFALWLMVRSFALSSWDWMFCFIGYPIVISWFVVFVYSCRHDFSDGDS